MQENMNGLEFSDEKVAEITRDIDVAKEDLFKMENVVGVGVGIKNEEADKPAVKVLVSQKLDKDLLSSQDIVPNDIGGTVTDVEEVGELFADNDVSGTTRLAMPGTARFTPVDSGNGNGRITLEAEEAAVLEEYSIAVEEEAAIQLLRTRIRPAMGGYSVGHYAITAGTIATCVYDANRFPGIPPKYYILSNNHILANSNNARVGHPILQPGRYDGGVYPRDTIARLSRWIPIRFGGPNNLVDAAIAEGPFQWLNREIYWIGYVKGVRNNWPAINEVLQKTGRTTNYTTGRVTAINATVNINYGGGRIARFIRQIVTRDMSGGGDSGSLVLDMNDNAIGLLFAGSSTHTILNHIYYVRTLLRIKVD